MSFKYDNPTQKKKNNNNNNNNKQRDRSASRPNGNFFVSSW